jgi:putative tricarboxylic transport membrane protein
MKKSGLLNFDSATALLLIVFFAAYGLYGSTFRSTLGVDVIGPNFFPEAVSVLAVFLGCVLLVQSQLRQARLARSGGDAAPGKAASRLDPAILVPFALLLVYVLVFDWLGFPVSTFLFLAVASRFLGCRSWFVAIAFALIATLVSAGLFQYAFDADLPTGAIFRNW